MATTFSTMGANFAPFTNQCVDPADLDSWVDFNAIQSPTHNASGSNAPSMSRSTSEMMSPTNSLLPLDQAEDHQTPVQPSHEYDRWKQQTGIPMGSMASLQQNNLTGFSNTGLDDFTMFDGMGSSSGMDMDTALPAFFFPSGGDVAAQAASFIDPTAIAPQEEPEKVRFYPGMHQQAALAKAQAQAQAQAHQQRQQQMLAQQKHRAAEHQARGHASRRNGNQSVDARTEETIARVVNQIRHNTSFGSDGSSSGSVLPHIIRSKKDEDDMDEDERLLASEEGKKLSSKERRQLRNKVSARAFRSRRKEYIGQLEGEVNMKQNEANDLRAQNRALMEENARSRAFIEKLLRHPAFHPFLDDLSRDPALSKSLADAPPAPQRKEVDFAARPPPPQQQQQYLEPPKIEQPTHVGMTMIPETPLDMSMLNLGPNNYGFAGMGFAGYQQPQVYAVLELPAGPAAPLDLSALSGKACDGFSTLPAFEASDRKPEYPALERDVPEPAETSTPSVSPVAPLDIDENDPAFTLYIDTPAAATKSSPPTEPHDNLFGALAPEKVFAHFELFVASEADGAESQRQMERMARMCARMEVAAQRIGVLTSHLAL